MWGCGNKSMKNLVRTIVAVIVIISGIFFFARSYSAQSLTTTPSPTNTDINITASFAIITDKITRSFRAEKYHNQSPDVFITNADPTIVMVKKAGITWTNFFETLPMELTKECLITGDGEKLCDPENGSLKFYLNDKEDSDALNQEVKQGDSLLVKFTSD